MTLQAGHNKGQQGSVFRRESTCKSAAPSLGCIAWLGGDHLLTETSVEVNL
jgi:hypothetical protein